MRSLHTVSLQSLDGFGQVYSSQHSRVGLAEICGGEARTSLLVARRMLTHGPNFDLVVCVYLTVASARARVLNYFGGTCVLVAVVPVCGPYGLRKQLNWAINPQALRRQLEIVQPMSQFCGHVEN